MAVLHCDYMGNNFIRNWPEKGMNTKVLLNFAVHFPHAFFTTALIACRGADLIEGIGPCVFNAFIAIATVILSGIPVHAGPKKKFPVTKASENIVSEFCCLWSWCWFTCRAFPLWAARQVVTAKRLNRCYMHHSLLGYGPVFWLAHAASYIEPLPIQVVVVFSCKSLNMLKWLVYWPCYLFMDVFDAAWVFRPHFQLRSGDRLAPAYSCK